MPRTKSGDRQRHVARPRLVYKPKSMTTLKREYTMTHGRLRKGSKRAKEVMASIRAMKTK
jgi:hypothetical protein